MIVAEGLARTVEKDTDAAAGEENSVSSKTTPQCVTGALAETLENQLASIERRELAIGDKEQTIRVLSEQVEKRIVELQRANDRLSSAISKIEKAKDGEIKQVAAIYGQMKPQLAGAIIDKMAPEFAAGLLLEMEGERASAVIASLDPARAYLITVLMSRRTTKVLSEANEG